MLENLVQMLPELDLRKRIESISTRGSSKTDKLGEELRTYYNLEDDINTNTMINKEAYIIYKNIEQIIKVRK